MNEQPPVGARRRRVQPWKLLLGWPWLLSCTAVSPTPDLARSPAPSPEAVAAASPQAVAAAPPAGVTIVDPGHGSTALAAGSPGASQLSGIVYAGADRYYAISDAGAVLFELSIQIDPASAAILSASVVDSQVLASGSDLEGLVHHPLGGSVLAADEAGPAIREYRLSDGAELSSVALPPVYAQVRSNLSLESLSMRVAASGSDDALWTANEEALAVDGPTATASAGTLVRLQRFDATFAPDGQWAYLTDPYPGAPFLGQERSGVADLLALPDGELLVLERSFSSALFRARLYQVDFDGATDTSALASLATDPFTPVGKTLLWERTGVLENFEGLTLGPPLDAGDQGLLLVSDNGSGAPQSLYPLRISAVPEPGATTSLLVGVLGLVALARARS
jgi:hypothetical protein